MTQLASAQLGAAGLRRMFGSLSYSMFTLFQFMTFDSWAVVARPRPQPRQRFRFFELELMADQKRELHMGSSWDTYGILMGYFTGKHGKNGRNMILKDLFEHL